MARRLKQNMEQGITRIVSDGIGIKGNRSRMSKITVKVCMLLWVVPVVRHLFVFTFGSTAAGVGDLPTVDLTLDQPPSQECAYKNPNEFIYIKCGV